MRQVDLDELTYQIFSGLRTWTASVRSRVFAPIAKRRDVHIRIAADQILPKLRCWTFIDLAAPAEAISMERISGLLVDATLALPGAIPALWRSGQQEREREARAAAAALFARALAHFEILSETTLAPHGARVVWFRTPEAPAYAFASSWP